MKAKLIATGEIIEIDNHYSTIYIDKDDIPHSIEEFEFPHDNPSSDYWEKLKHQAAVAAMQGMLCNRILAGELVKDNNNGIKDMSEVISKAAVVYATTLVEKLKESKV